MNLKILLLIPALVFLTEHEAYSQWKWKRTKGPSGGEIFDLAKNADTQFAGSENGIFRSVNEGWTWERLEDGLPFSLRCYQIKVQDESLLIFGSDHMEPHDATYDYDIFKSIDNGDNWYEIHPPDSVRFPDHIALHDNLIFVAENSLLRTEDDGLTWETLLDISDAFYNSAHTLKIFNEKLYVLGGKTIWITEDWGDTWSTVDLPENGLNTYDIYVEDSLMVLVCQEDAYRSIDSGATWEKANGWHDANPTWKDIVELRDTLYTNSAYVLRSADQGLNWEIVPAFSNLFYPQGILEFYGGLFAGSYSKGIEFAYPQDTIFQQRDYLLDATLISCLEIHDDDLWSGSDYNGLYRFRLNSLTWDKANYFPIQFHISDIAWIGDTMFIIYDYGDISRSVDGGMHWTQITPDELDESSTFYVIGTTLFVIDVYGVVVALSEDYGDTWTTPFPEFKNQIGGVPVGMVQNGEYIFVSDFYKIYRSADDGNTWEEMSNGLAIPEGSYIRKIFAQGGELLVESFSIDMVDYTFPLKLYTSRDNGENWTLTMDGLPDIRSYSQEIPSVNDLISVKGTLVMGTDLDGIYFKTKSEDEWQPLMVEGVFPKYVSSLALSNYWLYAGTEGMGVWELLSANIPSDATGLNSLVGLPQPLSIIPNPALDHIVITPDHDEYGNASLAIYNLEGKLVYSSKVWVDQKPIKINISGISGGEYVVVMETSDQKYSGTFTKN